MPRLRIFASLAMLYALFSSLTSGSALAVSQTLPLGDGRTTTTSPKVDWIYACRIITGGGGAIGDAPWITGDRWNPSQKPVVQGSNSWPQASISLNTTTTTRQIKTNGVPIGSTTGNFPISPTDPAYRYDRNPNSVKANTAIVSIPRYPKMTTKPTCLSLGPIGYGLNGVAIFNGLDGENRDAVAHEIQDSCGGHPERTGVYHYHSGSPCLTAKATGSSTLVGYALDGFGIYVERNAGGQLLKNADLDVCHGRTSEVTFNGKKQKIYHYVITEEYPYTLGCYRGTPTVVAGNSLPGNPPPPRR